MNLINFRKKNLTNLVAFTSAMIIFIVILLLNTNTVTSAMTVTVTTTTTTTTTKTVGAKTQIVKAQASVTIAEKIVNETNFNALTAQNKLYLATIEVLKIKPYGKMYDNDYNMLANRIAVIKKKINDRKSANDAYAKLVLEAGNAVTKAEKFIYSENTHLSASPTDLVTAQEDLSSALETVSRLDKTTEIYKNLMNRVDKLNAVIIDSMDDILDKKPVIYLYPTTKQNLNVKIDDNVRLSCSYPKYNKDGWNMTAYPDGTLVDKKTGRQYYCLYWEGIFKHSFNMSDGFVVEGKNTAQFLENKLKKLGLTDKEANEFIIYWLPQLAKNKYNLIHFATGEYNKQAPLEISPKPDSLIRILMVYKPLSKPIKVNQQKLITPNRKGFIVVEWGGMKIK